MKVRSLLISLTLGLGLTLGLLRLLGEPAQPVRADPGVLCVAPGGSGCDTAICGSICYASVQAAVDAAVPGDEIRVAAGTYTDVQRRPAPAGYSGSSVITQVVYISKTVTIRGGYTTTNWTTPYPITQPTTLDAQGQGRIILVAGYISPTIEGLHITGGDADGLAGGALEQHVGGGVYVITATATISGNRIYSNTAGLSGFDSAGGIYLASSDSTLIGNVIISNTATTVGGVKLQNSGASLRNNTIIYNTAPMGWGGGIGLFDSDAALISNTIAGNTVPGSDGGGIFLYRSDALLVGNRIYGNVAHWGGGLYLYQSDATLINNVIVDNKGLHGVCVESSSPTFLHTTIARNNGVGVEIPAGASSVVTLTNTILASQLVGIYVKEGSTAILNATLWHNNTVANWMGNVIHTNDYTGDPAFVDPDAGDYHIGLASAAIDKGVNASVTDDIDGDSRPQGGGYDLGADEAPVMLTLAVTKQASPDPVQAGSQLTYTIHVTNTGNVDLHATITDILPDHVTPSGILTWTPIITAPGGVWTEQAVVTVEVGYAGLLTNVVQVMTEEGATGIYTRTVTSALRTCWARLNDAPTDYPTVQAAVDAAHEGDIVKVAGYCTGVEARAGDTQVVYISKTVTIRGGYTTTNWTTPYPITQPTTLDAQGQGRVIHAIGKITLTIEGLRITGGDAGYSDGGGLYLDGSVSATLSGNTIISNTAGYGGCGGGLCLYLGNDVDKNGGATLSGNTIISNTASYGGGLCLHHSTGITLSDNTIVSNTAQNDGGGLYLGFSSATFSGNAIYANTAQRYGGGLCLENSDTTLIGNDIHANTAQDGGGLYWYPNADTFSGGITFNGNTVISNIAVTGGGLYLGRENIALSDNTIVSNTAQYGGGLYLVLNKNALLSRNTIASNRANQGGGLYLAKSDAILTNNVIADNRSSTLGSGLYIRASSPHLLHATIARNSGGDGSGVYITQQSSNYSNVFLTNTILFSHTVGVTVTAGNTATLNATLWHANSTNWSGNVIHTNDYTGDPAFVNPNAGDYHIGLTSTAIDRGVDVGVTDDIDGNLRPQGGGYDLGADEFVGAAPDGYKTYLPLIIRQHP